MKKYFNYNFIKENKIVFTKGNVELVMLSPFLVRTINISKRKEFVNKVKEFLLTMSNKCPYFNIDLFHANFSKTQFKFYTRNNSKTGIVIFLKKKCKIYDMEAIFHELIHLATIKIEGSIEYCGFSVNDYYYGDSFAKGLNEGYTQLIKERYFGKDSNLVYPVETKIASMIEALIGKDKMEELFFNIDLKGLFKELEKYASTSDIKLFLRNLDYINDNFPPKDANDVNTQKIFDRIHNFLFSCFKKKLELEPNNDLLERKMHLLFEPAITYKYSKNKSITINNLDPNLLVDFKNNTNKKR